MKHLFFSFLVLSLLLITSVSAVVQYNNPNLPKIETATSGSVSVSGNGTFNQTLTDATYLRLTGLNANQDINIGVYNISAASNSYLFRGFTPYNLCTANNSYCSTYNATYAIWAYNQTIPGIDYTNSIVTLYNATWSATYNVTYATFAYNQTTPAITFATSVNTTYSVLLNQNCGTGKVINGTYPNGTFVCTTVSSGGLSTENIAFQNQSNSFNGTQSINNELRINSYVNLTDAGFGGNQLFSKIGMTTYGNGFWAFSDKANRTDAQWTNDSYITQIYSSGLVFKHYNLTDGGSGLEQTFSIRLLPDTAPDRFYLSFISDSHPNNYILYDTKVKFSDNVTYTRGATVEFNDNVTISDNRTVVNFTGIKRFYANGSYITDVCLANGTNCVAVVATATPWSNTSTQVYVTQGYPALVNVSNNLFVNTTNVGVGMSTPVAKLHVEGTGGQILGVYDDNSIADGNALKIYSKVDPINGGYAATYLTPTLDNHQINLGDDSFRPYRVTMRLNNDFTLNYVNGAIWQMYALDSTKMNIGVGGASWFWQGQYAASGSTATNTFHNVISTAGIALAAQAVALQTGDLQQWQNETGYGLSVVNVNGSFGIRRNTATAYVHLGAGTTAPSTAPLKFTNGTLMTTPEVGAIEFTNDEFYATLRTGTKRVAFLLDNGNTTINGNVTVLGRINVSEEVRTKQLMVSNASNSGMDRCTLVSGACKISNTKVKATTNIFCFQQQDGGSIGSIRISARQVANHYNVTSSNILDTSVVGCMLVEPQ